MSEFGMLSRAVSVAISLILIYWPSSGTTAEFERIASGPNSLVVADGIIEAELNPSGCADGYENACSVRLQLQRSETVFTKAHRHGSTVTYRWEVFVPEAFVYNSLGGHLRAARLVISSGDSILSFLLDGDDGYHVNRKKCFGPEQFGEWHSVEAQVAWDSTKKENLKDRTPGKIRVLCNDQEVYATSGRPTIAEGEEVRLALGLMGALKLAEGDNVRVRFQNFSIEEN